MRLRILHVFILFAGILAGILLASAVPGHGAAASSKPAYKVDVVYQERSGNVPIPMQERIQSLVEERSSEGWEFVSISAWPQSVANALGDMPSMNAVLVFKR